MPKKTRFEFRVSLFGGVQIACHLLVIAMDGVEVRFRGFFIEVLEGVSEKLPLVLLEEGQHVPHSLRNRDGRFRMAYIVDEMSG